jgi:AraC-like DNA-binding protein
MRQRKLLLGLAGGGLLLMGVAIGALLGNVFSALASPGGTTHASATAGTGHYCQLFEQTLAQNLHVSPAQLETATQDALTTTIQQAYTDGTITQAQETTLLHQVSQLGAHPCAALRHLGALGRRGAGVGGAQFARARQAILHAVATTLKLAPSTLQADLAAGQTLAQIAAAQHVAIADVNTVYLGAVHEQLTLLVGNGTLTQAQVDRLSAKVQQAVTSGHYPLLEGRGGHL